MHRITTQVICLKCHNVAVSRDNVTKFLTENPVEGIDPNVVADIIRTTQYPYVVDGKDLNLKQAILRDADLMMCLEDDWPQTVILGIREELKLDMEKTINGQEAFLKNISMNTEWGKIIKEKHWAEAMRNFQRLKEIYLHK